MSRPPKRPRQEKSHDTKRFQQTNLSLWKLDPSEETEGVQYDNWKAGQYYKQGTVNLWNRVLKIGNTLESWMKFWDDITAQQLVFNPEVFGLVNARLDELAEEWIELDDKIRNGMADHRTEERHKSLTEPLLYMSQMRDEGKISIGHSDYIL